ncbi:Hypothetical protein FKW44_008838, partial [Caligus rogercresseyi]
EDFDRLDLFPPDDVTHREKKMDLPMRFLSPASIRAVPVRQAIQLRPAGRCGPDTANILGQHHLRIELFSREAIRKVIGVPNRQPNHHCLRIALTSLAKHQRSLQNKNPLLSLSHRQQWLKYPVLFSSQPHEQ